MISEGPLLSTILGLALPMLVGAVLQNVQSLIDLFWVGRLGAVAVASVAMGGTILMLLNPMLMGLSTGTVAVVARAMGARDFETASRAMGQSLLLSILLGGVSAWVGWFVSPTLLRWMGASSAVLEQGGLYLRIMFAGSFTAYALFVCNAAFQGAGDANTPMYLMAGANVVNIIADPLLIFGVGPFPRLGVAGAALATVLSQTLVAIIALSLLLNGRTHVRVRAGHWRPDPGMAWRILRIGVPGTGQMFSRGLMSIVLMSVVASCGTAAVAAYGIGLRFHFILLMPAFALGAAAATMMGQNLGAGKPERARRAVWLAAALDVLIMVFAAILLMGSAPALMRFFNANPDVVSVGSSYLRIVSPFHVMVSLGNVLGRGLNGAGATLAPMVITILSLWGWQVPAALWLSKVMNPSTNGVWWAIALAFLLQGLLMVFWFERGTWRHTKI